MSSIGPSGFLPVSLAGNAAANATQQKEHQQSKDAVASKNFERELKHKTEQTASDVEDPNLTGDRDADGRLLAQDDSERQQTAPEGEHAVKTKSALLRSIDPDGEVGTRLDLDA